MSLFTFFTYIIALLVGVLAASPLHPGLQLRAEDACGTYISDREVGTLWLNPACQNMAFFPVNATRVTNPKCQMCMLFTGQTCSGDLIYIGKADGQYQWWVEKKPRSYYCKDTFP